MTTTIDKIMPPSAYANDTALKVPAFTLSYLRSYIERGAPVGHFLSKLLANDLFEACFAADGTNRPALPDIVLWLFNYAPRACWGSADKVEAWQLHNGLTGICERLNADPAEHPSDADRRAAGIETAYAGEAAADGD